VPMFVASKVDLSIPLFTTYEQQARL